jgi:hypothetical protein
MAALYYTINKYEAELLILKTHSIEVENNLNAKIATKDSTVVSYEHIIEMLKNNTVEYRKKIDSLSDELSILSQKKTIELSKIKSNTLKEDSAYFALKSGYPVTITRDSVVELQPIQLNFANLNIFENEMNKLILHTKDSLLIAYDSALQHADSVSYTYAQQSNELKLLVELQKAKIKERELVHEDEIKTEKKKKKNAFFTGAGVGSALILILVLLVR